LRYLHPPPPRSTLFPYTTLFRSSQAYRAYFAIRGLASSQGLPTNAVYGFAIMLKRVLEKYPPDYIAVALDSSERTARHAQYEFRSEEHTSELQSRFDLVCRLLLE